MQRFLANYEDFTIEEIDYIASHVDKYSYFFKNLPPTDENYGRRFYFQEPNEKVFPTYSQAQNWLLYNIDSELKSIRERLLKLEFAKRKFETEKV